MYTSPPRAQAKLLELGILSDLIVMAAIDGLVPIPPAPLAPSRLTVAAADAVVCLLLASAWFLVAGVGALLIGHLTCDIKCPVVIHAASTVILVAGISFLILCTVGVLLFSKFVQPASYTNGSEKTAATQGIMDSTVMAVHIISSLAFTCIDIIGVLLKCFAASGGDMEDEPMRPFGRASRSAEPIFSRDMEEQQVAN
ncbi:unnamed protein product [Urochloa decumbens]|uniref:Uncharacterized protein n=1 Tax=Urochloa decumbens TaxID=240449 RepID=A0ABC9BCU2_9POAL